MPMERTHSIIRDLQIRFGDEGVIEQPTKDGIPTMWAPREQALPILRYLKTEIPSPYRMLYDLTAIDERVRSNREGQPEGDFAVVYHLLSYDRNADVRIKTSLKEND